MTDRPNVHLLTVAEAARRLTLSLRTVRKLIQTGEIPVVRLGGRRLAISAEDLAAYVAAQRRA